MSLSRRPRWSALVPALVLLALLAGCGPDREPGSDREPDPDRAQWGPLTVINVEASGGAEALIGEGTLQIDEHCVTLDLGAREVLLVWKVEQTDWDATQNAIHYTNLDGSSITLRDGDQVTIEGGGVGPEGGGGEPPFLSPPDPRCPDDQGLVSGVRSNPP